MTYAVIDCETTTFMKGNPFSYQNKLCLVGVRINDINTIIEVEYDSTKPYAESLAKLRDLVNSCDTWVIFNGKFDLNWLGRYDVFPSKSTNIRDCQLIEFILGNQRPAYPSLNDCLAKYSLGYKLDTVDSEYWSRGIDTPDIPLSVLTEYLNEDLRLTNALYNKQLDCIPETKQRLIDLQQQDLKVLQEMEFNGQLFNWESLDKTRAQTERELRAIDSEILGAWIHDPSAREVFNINSGDHLSCLLYGGCIRGKWPTPYKHQYKSGPRAGETIDANRWKSYEYYFERLVEPPAGSELKKDGFYSTDEETLLSLARPKKLITLLLNRAGLAKLSQTYLEGIPKIAQKYDWQDGLIHGTFNQCRTITGRLSSEKPNQQNYPETLNGYIISRFS